MPQSTDYVKKIIDKHIQVGDFTCVPSSVEMTLKILGKVPIGYYDLQLACNLNGGCFTDHDGQTINGITFRRVNIAPRGPAFPFTDLFNLIDQELLAERYVMIALEGSAPSGIFCYHGFVIFAQRNNDYVAVTKAFDSKYNCVTQFDYDIKNKIRRIHGTDILVYTT